MIYYNENNILIRNMVKSDVKNICLEETAQGWHPSEGKYLQRLDDQDNEKSISLVAEYKGNIAGYINVYFCTAKGPFVGLGYCEIVDFGVLEKYRNNGVGSILMDIVEQIASNYSNYVCLAVGLHSGYGSAQRMYVKRGYILDGTGVWYDGEIANPYERYCNDDDLNLYLIKKLR